MWWWLAAFVVSLLVTYAVMSMIPKPETGKPPEVEEFDGPTAIDGREITVLFGTRNFLDLQVHWWGDVRTGPRKDADTGDIVVGYHYYVGMHLIACLGPVDFLSGIWVDERPLAYSPTGEFAGGSILVDNLDLFGGPAGEGGVKGYIDVEMGLPTQGRNSYLEHNLDGGDAPGDFEAHDIPAFRGVVGLVLKSIYIGHTPYLKKWMIRLQRIHLRQDGIEQWYDEKAEMPVYCSGYTPLEPKTDIAIALLISRPDETGDGDVNLHAWPTLKLQLRDLYTSLKVHLELDAENPWNLSILVSYETGSGNSSVQYNNCTLAQMDLLINTTYQDSPPGFIGVDVHWTLAIQRAKDHFNHSSNVSIETKFVIFLHRAGIQQAQGGDYYHEPLRSTCGGDIGCSTAVGANIGMGEGFDILVSIEGLTAAYFLYQQWRNCTNDTQTICTEGGYPIDLTDTIDTINDYMAGLTDNPIGDPAIFEPMFDDTVDNYTWPSDAYLPSTAPVSVSRVGFLANDLNPSHLIRECLTDPDWGINGDEASPDETAFVYAADYLYNENMGISLKWTSQSDIEEFIELVKKHINAELYPDHTTGKFILKLIRDDYNVASLPILGESDIVKVENAKRPLIGDLVNSVTVQYWDTCIGEDSSVTVQDSALIHMQGKEINTTVQYPGFTYKDIAVRVATRDLRALSSQLLSCTLYAKRTAEALNLGSVFVMHWPDLEISGVVMRVQDIDFGDGRKNTIKIDAVEDVFGLPATVVVGDNDNDPVWVPPIQDAVPLAHELAVEAPYYELLQKYGETELTAKLSSNPDLGYALAGGIRVTNSDIDAVISTDDGSGYADIGRMDLCGSVEITADVDQIEKVWGYTGGIDLDQLEIGTHAQIDDELVVIESIVQTDAITGTITVGRAVLDTSPRDHAAGSRLIAWDEYNYIDTTEYDDGDTVSLKIRPTTGHGTLALADATALPVVMDSRALRPYPPGDLQIDGDAYPTADITANSFNVTWSHRDRLTQGITPHPDGDTGPEAGVTYTVYIIDSGDVTQLTYSAISGASQTVDMSAEPNGNYTLQLLATRDGAESWQHVLWNFYRDSSADVKADDSQQTGLIDADSRPWESWGSGNGEWSINNSVITVAATTWLVIRTLGILTDGTEYTMRIEILTRSGGSIEPRVADVFDSYFDTVGVHEVTGTATSGNLFVGLGSSNFIGTVRVLSVIPTA